MVQDLSEFCRLYYETTSIPMSVYFIDSDETIYYPASMEDRSIFRSMLPVFSKEHKNPEYYVSPSFAYYGYLEVTDPSALVFIGPVFGTPANTDTTLRAFMREWSIHPDHKERISAFLSTLPVTSFHRFLNILAYLQFCLNDETIDVSKHFGLSDTSSMTQISTLHSDLVFESRETQTYHNTWKFERQLMQLVQKGEVEKLKKFLMESASLNAGNLADNPLRQEKNIFITLIAQVMRAAINGGMNMEQAYQLADVYIMDCEKSQDINHVQNLSYTMLVDYATRVSENQVPEGMSQEIFECIQFIQQNINTPLQVTDVADHIGKSRSYLSNRFKEELGFDISSFIMRCRLEEAKSLLIYSDKSLIEISEYLCFSSQSYFQNVFKKKYGMTPRKFRQEHSKL